MGIDFDSREMIVDRWPTLYHTQGYKYKGECTVTNAYIRFDLKMLSDTRTYEHVQYKLVIQKCYIRQVYIKRSLFSRRVVITLVTGEKYVFSCPMFKTYRVMSAIHFMRGC